MLVREGIKPFVKGPFLPRDLACFQRTQARKKGLSWDLSSPKSLEMGGVYLAVDPWNPPLPQLPHEMNKGDF